jgi:carbamoyltransferase
MVYSAFTAYCGFKVNSGEYKLMGLAPFGKDVYKDRILKDIITLRPDGSYKVNSSYLPFVINSPILNSNFISYWGRAPRDPEDESGIDKFYCDIAASIQSVLNEYILLIAKRAKLKTKSENLCLAGGVALNCVSNSVLVRSNIFKNVWIQPAAGDAGTSLGAALLFSSTETDKHSYQNHINQTDYMKGAFLGSHYSKEDVLRTLKDFGLSFLTLSKQEIDELVVRALLENKIIGYFQGRMEFGPRALGSRSILANPKDPNGQSRINKAIKFRESFRPFAPAMLPEVAIKYFKIEKLDPYMLFTWFLKDEYRIEMMRKYNLSDVNLLRSKYPSITHMDYSARVQVVEKSSPLFDLLQLGLDKSDVEMVVNTSFNVRGEPIVESPKNAIECFLSTAIDYLAIGNFWVDKSKQTNLHTIKRKTYFD